VYQPGHRRFEVDDPAALLTELCARVPATLVTLNAGTLHASLLPMLFDADEAEHGVLRGHLARGNPQWRDFDPAVGGLAIFDGPDAYISPSWYDEKARSGKVVPTWNYVTIQARGPLRLRHEPEWLAAHVSRLVDRHESAFVDPWSVNDAPAGYIESQARAIVGLELEIQALEAKRKLNQNRSAADVRGVIESLEAGDAEQQAVAEEMRRG
jgi:transcriptional regulator